MASREQIHEVTDENGQVVRSSRVFTAKYKSQPFITLPLPVSPLLHALSGLKDVRVLLALAELAEFNTNAVFLIASRRLEVMQKADVSSPQLSSCLKRLREAGVISGRKGEAIIHPSVLWKGESAVKKEVLARLAKEAPSTFDTPIEQ